MAQNLLPATPSKSSSIFTVCEHVFEKYQESQAALSKHGMLSPASSASAFATSLLCHVVAMLGSMAAKHGVCKVSELQYLSLIHH